jgi:hypothetical protein|tara:strand:- start:2263 stop:2802 length:540 start_codon:yes stop_codon:yes gene_type:complete
MADPFVYEAIETVSLTSTQTSVTFSSLTTDYEHLEIHMTVRTDLNTTYGYDYVGVRFNGDTGSNYATQQMYARDTTMLTERETANANGMKVRAAASDPENALNFGGISVLIPDYRGANVNKSCTTMGGKSAASNNGWTNNGTGEWDNTAAITSVELTPGGGTNFNIGCVFTIYGLRSSV